MDVLRLSIERIAALVVIGLNVLAAGLFSTIAAAAWVPVVWAALLSLPGLFLIWFREGLSVVGFARGVFRESPPLFIDAFGWVFLIGLPAIFLYGLLP